MARLPLSSTIEQFEDEILQEKRELALISQERWRASLEGDAVKVFEARRKAAERMLDCCRTTARYIGDISTPAARRLQLMEAEARRELAEVSTTRNLDLFQIWCSTSLVPVVRDSERMAHIVATSVRKARGEKIDFHRWITRQV